MKIVIFLFSATLTIFLYSCSSKKTADIVFTNGKVYTLNEAQPWAEALAVKGNKIIYVGDTETAKKYISEKTEILDLSGKMMLPGFVEGHIHPVAGALVSRGIDVQSDNPNEVLAMIKDYAEAVPDASIIRGFGFRYTNYPDTGPLKEDLDAINSERPIFIFAVDGHGGWVNSKALKVAGITKHTADTQPPFSIYQRDPDGTPTGYLIEVPAMLEVLTKLSPVDVDFIAQGMEEWFPKFSAAGITTVIDAGILGISSEDGFNLYLEMEKKDKLPFRVVGSYYWNNPSIDPLPIIKEYRKKFNSDLLDVRILKINADGGDAQHTAYMLDSYTDRANYKSKLIIPEEIIRRVVTQADKEEIDTHTHVYGDAAVRVMLDVFEEVIKENPSRDRRHSLGHIFLIHPDDIPRFGELGVIGHFSIQWAAPEPVMEISTKRLGPERVSRLYQPKTIIDAGGKISFGTDWPAAGHYSTYKPLESIQVAVTRQELTKHRINKC